MSDSDLKIEQHTDSYKFIPTIGKDGVIDYTGVSPDKFYLANRKKILTEEYPSYLPPVHIRRSSKYDIPCYKVKDNEYLLRESDTLWHDEKGNLHNPRIYRVSLDVYAALVNYHLEYVRAFVTSVAKRNEEERARALTSGSKEYQAIHENDLPEVPVKIDIQALSNTYTHRYTHIEQKPSRVALISTKSNRMSPEPFYFIQDMGKAHDKELTKGEIFRMHRECIDDVRQKILDMELQKADWESTWTKGRETSYGNTNLDDTLLQEYGIRVKRQNGDRITNTEIEELKETVKYVYSVFGNIAEPSREFGLKVSHAGTTRMHASKYVGLFSPYYNTIGISFSEGAIESRLTAIHEYAHFLDHLSGKEQGAWHASDIPGTPENKIAVSFREKMNSAKGEYWGRTCECFARAIEESVRITMLRESIEVDASSVEFIESINKKVSIPASVDYLTFHRDIEPEITLLLGQYRERYAKEITITKLAPIAENKFAENSGESEKDIQNGPFTQLELFQRAAAYHSSEREETDGQIFLFPEGDPQVTREHITAAKAAQRFYTYGILKGNKSGLWKSFRDFKKHGVLDIKGTQIATEHNGAITREGWEQLYQALNIYRDKRFETFRVLFISTDGTIKDQVAISSHLPNCVNVSSLNGELGRQVVAYAEDTNAKIVIAHNHPSGSIVSSPQDEHLTHYLESTMVNAEGGSLLLGHIILDHDSFGLYTDGEWSSVMVDTPEVDPLLKRELPDFMQKKIAQRDILRSVAEKINHSESWNSVDWVPVLFTNSVYRISGIRYYSKDWLTRTRSEDLIREFQTVGSKTGSSYSFPILSRELASDLELREAVITHLKNGCFMDFCIAGETAEEVLGEYGSGFYASFTREQALAQTTVDSTFDLAERNGIVKVTDEAVASDVQGEYESEAERGEYLFRTDTSPALQVALDSISKADIGKPNERIVITEHTPFVFTELGLPNTSIEMYQDKIARSIMLSVTDRHGHNNSITKENVLEVFSQIANPRAIFRSKDMISLVAVYDVLDVKNEPIMISLRNENRTIEANLVTSVYGKPTRDIEYWLDDGRLLYVNDLDEKNAFMLPSRQLRMSNINAFTKQNIIRKSDLVNNNYLQSPTQEYGLFSADELESKPIQHRSVVIGEKIVIQDEEYRARIRENGGVTLINSENGVSSDIARSLSNLSTPAQVIEGFEQSRDERNTFDNTSGEVPVLNHISNHNNEFIRFSFKNIQQDVMFKINDSDWQLLGKAESELDAEQYVQRLEQDDRNGDERNVREMTNIIEQHIFSKYYATRETEYYLLRNPLGESEKELRAEINQELNIMKSISSNPDELNRPFESINLTETVQGSYNTIEENKTYSEELHDNRNRPQSQNERESEEAASIRTLPESKGLRRDNLLQTGGHSGVRAGTESLQSSGWQDIQNAGYPTVNGEFPEYSRFDDRDGSGSIRAGTLSQTEFAGDRGQPEISSGTSRDGYVSPKTAREIRAECLSILEAKNDSEITDNDRILLAQYEGAGGLGETNVTAAGVLSEFYTPNSVINSVWQLIDAYHPETHTVMEPAAGTGRFAQGRSEEFTLHELDETSSRIARILHPEAEVITGAFQKQFFDPSGRILNKEYRQPVYDVVVGNPPYGIYSGTWKGLGEGKHHARYEEYFLEKGLDSLKNDGILAYVVPSGFLRSGRDSVKEILASKGTLIDAWRLPNGAFPTTDVGTDIIIMKKGVSDPENISNDRFFIEHPEHVLGQESVRQGRFGQEQYIAIPEGQTVENLLQKIKPEPLVISDKTVGPLVEQHHLERDSIVNNTKDIGKSETLNTDYALNSVSSIQEVFSTEKTNVHTDVIADIKSKLLSSKEFNAVYGKDHDEREQPIWAATAWNGFIDLEKLDSDTRIYLEQNNNYVETSPGRWMHKILYASGNVYEKLDALETEFQGGFISEDIYKKNKTILEQNLPEKVQVQEIHFSPMTRLAEEFSVTVGNGKELTLKEGFINWVTGYAEENNQSYYGRRQFDPALSPLSKEDIPPNIGWYDILEYLDGEPVRARRGWSEEHKKAQQIEAEQKRVTRRDTADILFDRYLHEGLDEATSLRLETEWNRRFNCNVNPDYAKLPLYVEGMSVYKGDEPFTLYDQQIKGISFLSNKGNGLLAYDVGVGKTAAGIVSTVNQIQTGRASRPLIIVPKSVYSKWNRDIHQLFPNIPVNDLGNFSDKNLASFRTDNYGLNIPENSISVCTIEALQRISFTDNSISGPLFEDFSNLLGGIDDDDSEREKKQQAEKISESVGRASQTKEGFVFWENTGFDHITVDEAHRFKNLYKTPRSSEKGKANEYSGLGAGNPSARALKLFGITQLVQRNNENRNVFLLTATPFTNSPLEVYSMMSYMGRERLKEMHLYNLKSFMDEFAEMKNEWAVDAKGTIQTRQVMKNFRSLPALQNLLLEYIDKVDGEEAGVIRPRKFTHVEKLETTELQKKIIAAETERMLDKESVKNGGVLVAMNNMRMAMLSPSLLQNAGYPFAIPPLSEMVDCSPKLKMVCDSIVDCWTREPTGGQIMYMPRGVEESKFVKDYLVEKGIPEKVIGYINSSVTDAKKDALTEAFNDKTNQLKIIIGSETISEGVDLNGNSYVCYNTMLGWNPTETIQVEGRAWRQGNEQGHVHMVYPLMNDSIDALMYQKHDEKSSRINALWSYKGDRLNVEDINPEELKFDLVKDPAKKADFILSERTLDLRTEGVLVNGKLETIDTILEKQKVFQQELESSDEGISKWMDRKKEDRGSHVFYNQMIEREKEKKIAAERNLPSIKKKLEGMDLDTQDKIDTYVRSLNERKNEIADEIRKINESKDQIIAELTIEEAQKRAILPTFADSQRALVEMVVGNLRPMSEVEAEIRETRGEQQHKRNILSSIDTEVNNKSDEQKVDESQENKVITAIPDILQTVNISRDITTEKPPVIDTKTGQFELFSDELFTKKEPEIDVYTPELGRSSIDHEKERIVLMRNVEKQVLDSLTDTDNEHLKESRESFYRTIHVNPNEIFLYPNISLSNIQVPIHHEGITKQVSADIILHSAFISDSESSAGIHPDTIHGIDEYLNPANFSLSYFGMPKALDEATRLRKEYLQNTLRQQEEVSKPEHTSVLKGQVKVEQKKDEYIVGNIYEGTNKLDGKWRGVYAGGGYFEITKPTESGTVRIGDLIEPDTDQSLQFVGRRAGYKPLQPQKKDNVYFEPHNPVTGERFQDDNARKAIIFLERKKSTDPRFLEYSDILRSGLTLKNDKNKEALVISTNGTSRFFYHASDINGIPQNIKGNQPAIVGKKLNGVQKEIELEF